MAAALLQAKEKERMCEPQDTSQAPRERCQGFEALNPGACSQKEKKKKLRDKGCKEPHCCTEQEIGVCSPRRQVCHVLPRMTEGKADSTLTHPKQDLVRFLEVAKLKIPHFQGGERGGMLNQDVSTHTLPRGTEQLVSQPSENP